MSYRFKRREPAGEGVRRILLEQIDAAVGHLAEPSAGRDEGIHEARKCFKRTRAVLRLVRPRLPTLYRRENAVFRDAGRALAAARDAGAMVETIERLESPVIRRLGEAGYRDLHQVFVDRRDAVAGDDAGIGARVQETLEVLAAARERLAGLSPGRDGFGLLGPGLKAYYQRGRKARDRVLAEPTAENFHEWRKRVKDLWYFTQLLEKTDPPAMRRLKRDFKTLSDRLGDDHDLAVLRALLTGDEGPELADDVRMPLLEVVDAEQARLRADARELGGRLFHDKPGTFRKRMKRRWKAWRKG